MPTNKTQEKSPETVVIVGGGWSGLAAAVELTRNKVPVILLESARQLGGRARRVSIDDLQVDNGQHMMLGAYKSILSMLHLIGVHERDVLKRLPLSLQWLRLNGSAVSLKTPGLPAPLHLAWALLNARGLSLEDRISALKFCKRLQKINFVIEEDCSVETLLKNNNQSAELVTAIWEPLCLGALNTQIFEASAQIFVRTLKDSFARSRKDSDLLLTRQDLGSIFPEPASHYIESNNGSVRLGERVTGLNIIDNTISGVNVGSNIDSIPVESRYVILATPGTVTNSLIASHKSLQVISSRLQNIRHRPICTVYLQYPEKTKLGSAILGSLSTTTQWIFDRRLYGQNGLMSVVISGDGEHMNWDNDKLCRIIEKELASHFPLWPKPLSSHVIREKRATFASTVNINQFRPDNRTPVSGLWLAGDYTNNGLPGTLEGAVQSGLNCAQQIIIEQQQKYYEENHPG